MNKRETLGDRLLRADGIDPSGASETEMTRLRQLLDSTRPVESRWRRAIMAPVARPAVAALIVLAVLAGMHFVGGTSNRTWAAVLGRVQAMNTCVFRTRTMETTGPRPDGFEFATELETVKRRSDLYGTFDETYRNGELFTRFYQLLQAGECIGICYPLEQYTRKPMSEARVRELHGEDPRQIITRVLKADYVELGETTYEGKRTQGVELRDVTAFFEGGPPVDDFSARVWIDVQTRLPVVVDVSFIPQGSTRRTTVIMDEFQWGVPLEAGLFEPNIPARFTLDTEDKSFMDSAPKTSAAEAFAADTQARPYLSDFDHLKLPDVSGLVLLGVHVNVPKANVRLLSHGEVWELQDAFMATWPTFEDVKDPLRQELQMKLGIDRLGVDELVATGIALRERFWELVACFSETSYPYAYAARIVTEIAHEKAPDDLAVMDQLVESITTYAVTRTWHEDANQVVRNPIYAGLLTDLRLAQFEQIKRQVARGHIPAWKDFVRVHDLVMLLSANRKDYHNAALVTQWLIDQAPTAGWTYYLPSLKEMEQAYSRGDDCKTGLFLYGPDAFPAEYQYARRLFSFQGPRRRAETLLPVHLRHLEGR
ncbi:MAG: hypothetical protein JW955_01725 [Sedimentisphaerales bacterium]|nr:hypothetical protein [Sedimentisphaerales bacterium]